MPAPCTTRRCSWSALKHGLTMLVLREDIEPGRRGGQRAWTDEKDRESASRAGAASETGSSADGGTRSPIGDQSLRGMQRPLQD